MEERKKLVESYRPRIKKASYAFLISLSSDEIIALIKQYLIEPNKEMEEFITDGKENKTEEPVILELWQYSRKKDEMKLVSKLPNN